MLCPSMFKPCPATIQDIKGQFVGLTNVSSFKLYIIHLTLPNKKPTRACTIGAVAGAGGCGNFWGEAPFGGKNLP